MEPAHLQTLTEKSGFQLLQGQLTENQRHSGYSLRQRLPMPPELLDMASSQQQRAPELD